MSIPPNATDCPLCEGRGFLERNDPWGPGVCPGCDGHGYTVCVWCGKVADSRWAQEWEGHVFDYCSAECCAADDPDDNGGERH